MLKLMTDKIRLSLRINNVFNRDSYMLYLRIRNNEPILDKFKSLKKPKRKYFNKFYNKTQ